MISIERLTLSLPAELRHRARWIAQDIADELACIPQQQSIDIDSLSLPAIIVDVATSDRQLARTIATRIHQAVLDQGNAQPNSQTEPARGGTHAKGE